MEPTKNLVPHSPPVSDEQKAAPWKTYEATNPKPAVPSADPGSSGATAKNLGTTSSAAEKMESLWAFVEKTGVGLLSTNSKEGGMLGRAMKNLNIAKEGRGVVWFVSMRGRDKRPDLWVHFWERSRHRSRPRIATPPRSNT